jgi:AcrR family transcriptional regulator
VASKTDDGVKTGRSALAESTRANIIEVATAEFVDKGLAGARIDVIADKTHSSKRMIYYYFGGKDELYRAVLEQAYAGIRTREAEIDVAAMPAEEALRTLVAHTFDYHSEHPDFVRLVMNENILHGAHIAHLDSIKSRNRSVLSTLQGILDRGAAEGVFRENLDALDLHLSMSALSFYSVSNRYTLKANFGIDLAQREVRAKRFEQSVAMVMAYVKR